MFSVRILFIIASNKLSYVYLSSNDFQAYSDRIELGIWEFGTTITTSCMWAMLGQVSLETQSWVSDTSIPIII